MTKEHVLKQFIDCPVHDNAQMKAYKRICEDQDAESTGLTNFSSHIDAIGQVHSSARVIKEFVNMDIFEYKCPHGCTFSYQPKESCIIDNGMVKS